MSRGPLVPRATYHEPGWQLNRSSSRSNNSIWLSTVFLFRVSRLHSSDFSRWSREFTDITSAILRRSCDHLSFARNRSSIETASPLTSIDASDDVAKPRTLAGHLWPACSRSCVAAAGYGSRVGRGFMSSWSRHLGGSGRWRSIWYRS